MRLPAALALSMLLLSCAGAAERLALNGSTRLEEGRLVLTPLEPNQRGSAWSPEPIEVAGGFETRFRFRVDRPPEGDVADGLAFVLQASPEGPQALGGLGQALGYAANGAAGHRGIANSLAVELDIFQNRDPDGLDRDNRDPEGEHVAVMSRGREENSCDHRQALAQTADVPPLADGREHEAEVRYRPGTLTVTVDGEVVLEASLHLGELLALPDGRARAGFTAGTGGGTHSASILEWEWRSAGRARRLLGR